MMQHSLKLLDQELYHKSVLHVGCVGSWSMDSNGQNFNTHKYLLTQVNELFGVDIDKQGLEQMKKEGIQNIAESVEHLSKNYFDAIVILSVLEFIEAPIDFLRMYKTHLSKDGILVVEAVNVYCFSEIMRNLFKFKRYKKTPHVGQSAVGEVNKFSSSSLVKVFQAAGFNDIEVYPVYRKQFHKKASFRENFRVGLNNIVGFFVYPLCPGIMIVAKV